MKITIVYDNEVYKKDLGLKAGWGFSCLIEAENDTVLFDTGADGKVLLNNMKKLGIYPRSVNKIAISHEHWDHNGGLKALVPLVGDIELYRLANKSPSENMHLVSAEEPVEITERVHTTGRIRGVVDEQSLVLNGKKGWYVLVGCSHPGVEKILNTAKQHGNIIGLIGGLHGFNNFSVLKDLDLVCATHCTKHKREINKLFPKTSVEGGVGRIVEL
ncbi:MAG: MBL fold metallo-hydrolase [Candidatus Thermoplasmatota archaeon]|nr:MBL fold metallo-hydrolase [Candidatus Thermoplasmatota archaeon]